MIGFSYLRYMDMQASPKRKKLFRIFAGVFVFFLFLLINIVAYDTNENRYYEAEVANGEVTHIFTVREKGYITINGKDHYVDAKTYSDSVIGHHKILIDKRDKLDDNAFFVFLCFIAMLADIIIFAIVVIFLLVFFGQSVTWALHYSDGKYTYKEYLNKYFW